MISSIKEDIQKVIKRNGHLERFDRSKIYFSIINAARKSKEFDKFIARQLTDKAVILMSSSIEGVKTPHVSEIADLIEKLLIAYGYYDTAKQFIQNIKDQGFEVSETSQRILKRISRERSEAHVITSANGIS